MVLIYPKTSSFDAPLPVFEFVKPAGKVKLWVLPFDLDLDLDLKEKRLLLPDGKGLDEFFKCF